MLLAKVGLAVLAGYGLSVLFFLARRASWKIRTIELVIILPAVLACPLLIDPSSPVLRCLAAGTLAFFAMKLWDLYLHPTVYAQVSLWTWLAFLMNHRLFAPADDQDFVTRLPFQQRLREFNLRTAILIVTSLVSWLMWGHDWTGVFFWVEHFVKGIVGLLWIQCIFEFYGAIWQLGGARIIPFFSNTFQAETPARLWRRWHHSMYPWFLRDIAEPLRRIGPGFVPVMASFVVSGLLHEYMFVGMPLGRFSGYMLAFFIVQGTAVIVTHRLALAGPWRFLGVVLTNGFLLFSAVWFVAPVNPFLHFYDNSIPKWILPW